MNKELIICPGETIKELLETYNYTQKDLANKLGMELKTVNEILNGKGVITFETAIKLGSIFNMPASFWNNLEFNYRKDLKDLEEAERAEQDYQKIETAYKELVKRNKIEVSKEKSNKVATFKSFMEIADLDDIENEYEMAIACRKAQIKEFNVISLMTWIQCGIKKTRETISNSFDREKVLKMIPEIKELTLLENQQEALTKLKELCAGCGIVLSYEKAFPNTGINGIAKWVTADKAFIQVSDRGKKADTFWFTFMHELGHIMKGKKKMFFIDEECTKSEGDEERIANDFAMKMLIEDKKGYEKLKKYWTVDGIKEFAKRNCIHEGIVAGMICHDNNVYDNVGLNRLRRKLDFDMV